MMQCHYPRRIEDNGRQVTLVSFTPRVFYYNHRVIGLEPNLA